MTDGPTEDDIEHRAELLPEELAAGSDDAEGQARAILQESHDRTDDLEGTSHESEPAPGE